MTFTKRLNFLLFLVLTIFSVFFRFWQLGTGNWLTAWVGSLDPWLLWLAARRLRLGLKESYVAAILLAMLPWHVQASRNFSLGVWVVTGVLLAVVALGAVLEKGARTFMVLCLATSIALLVLVSILKVPADTVFLVDQERSYMVKSGIGLIPRAFTNKVVESTRYYQTLLIENLDIGNYFFAGHPRERLGVAEEQKFYLILLPLGIYGFFKVRQGEQFILGGIAILGVVIPAVLGDRNGTWGLILTMPVTIWSAYGFAQVARQKRGFSRKGLFLALACLAWEEAVFMASFL